MKGRKGICMRLGWCGNRNETPTVVGKLGIDCLVEHHGGTAGDLRRTSHTICTASQFNSVNFQRHEAVKTTRWENLQSAYFRRHDVAKTNAFNIPEAQLH
jgi:hypothetical protein